MTQFAVWIPLGLAAFDLRLHGVGSWFFLAGMPGCNALLVLAPAEVRSAVGSNKPLSLLIADSVEHGEMEEKMEMTSNM